jgi:tRNA (cmo5U34)-methyltransferase
VSGLAIHHLPDARKRQLYQEVYELLGSGGLFLNDDAVTSPPALQEWFTALWYREMQAQEERLRGVKRSIEAIKEELQERLRVGDHPSYMAPLGEQLAWLREAGFTSVECYWKYLGFAIFGGVKE